MPPEEPVTPTTTPTPPVETPAPASSTPSPSPVTEPPKPAEPTEPKVEAPAPLTMESVKIPEGFEIDEKLSTEFLGVMNNAELDGPGRAQALIDLQAKVMQAASEKAVATWEKLQSDWQEETKADKEVGGDKLDANLQKISDLLNTHGTPELRLVFDDTGFGNNVHAVKFMTKIANLLGESRPVVGTPAPSEKSQAQKLFPSMKS